MIQTQLLKLDAPYQVIYCGGEVGLHVATLIVVDERRDTEGNYLGVETHSHPVVSYVSKDHPEDGSLLYPQTSEGVVWNKAELKDCTSIILADGRLLDFQDYMCIIRGWLSDRPDYPLYITQLAGRLEMLGVIVDVPPFKKGKKVRVWLCHDEHNNTCYADNDMGISLSCPWGDVETMAATIYQQEHSYRMLLKTYSWCPFDYKTPQAECEPLIKRLKELSKEKKNPF